jgi:hypothetical protein
MIGRTEASEVKEMDGGKNDCGGGGVWSPALVHVDTVTQTPTI